MYVEKFFPLINAFPQEADALKRLANHFAAIEREEGEKVFDVVMSTGRLYDISQAGSTAHFAKVTTILVESGLLERKAVVRSPLGTIIFECDNWFDIPLEVYDPLRDVTMEVNEGDIETLYRVKAHGKN
ncbi:hypothetical protein PPUJ20066_07940 [Pseudomonas putida]|nr:hypothetical protein PPUJ20066_07940 [Pseudomonas putida]